MAQEKWRGYYEATAGRPPRATLLDALARFPGDGRRRHAIDLGCGGGRDTIELLRRGWAVTAIDAEPAAIEAIRQLPDLPAQAALTLVCDRFETASLPAADLVNSSFALPLCPPEAFPALWSRIVAALGPGGRFCGQLYGERDGWAGRAGMTHHRRAEVERLLSPFEIELLDEEESDGVTPRGTPKHWHVFHIVARRRAAPTAPA